MKKLMAKAEENKLSREQIAELKQLLRNPEYRQMVIQKAKENLDKGAKLAREGIKRDKSGKYTDAGRNLRALVQKTN